MISLDRGHARLTVWVAATAALVLTLYSNQLFILISGLDELLTETLGTVFPAYPFLALLVLLTALRWPDFHRILLKEHGLTSMLPVRLAGVALVLLPAIVWVLVFGQGGPSEYLGMELSACSLVLVAYGSLLAINPTMWRIMLPYASLYALGLVSPLFMLDTLGAPMASFSSSLAEGMTSALGLHVAWQGVSFGFISSSGEPISAVVTPVCSAVYSISIYLALLGLMYLDMGSPLATTLKFAVVGLAVIPVLDSVRIALMIWFGFVDGSAAFWSIHDWLGYAMFFAFYLAVLLAYSRTVPRSSLAADGTAPSPARPSLG
jgi:exosortase/archaeosortase family protein